ncbi:hypothetical protein VPH35_127510 [Triticum aestivum]
MVGALDLIQRHGPVPAEVREDEGEREGRRGGRKIEERGEGDAVADGRGSPAGTRHRISPPLLVSSTVVPLPLWSTLRNMGNTEPARKTVRPCRRCLPATSITHRSVFFTHGPYLKRTEHAAASAKWQKGPGCIGGGPSAAASIPAPSSSHAAASFRTPLLRVLSGSNNIIELASFSWKRSGNLKVHATYSLRSELLVAEVDVSRHILVLHTSISETSNFERRE